MLLFPKTITTTTMSISSIQFPQFPIKNPPFHNPIFTPIHYKNPQNYVKIQSLTNIPLHFNKTNITHVCFSTNSASNEDDDRELHVGILDILLESGVLADEAMEIGSKSPKYAKMLRDGVRDLDEVGMWSSWMMEKNIMTDLPPVSLKEKVKCIAREKGDNGKIPYLESVGLSLSSAVHLSRILSSHSLSSLIYKGATLKTDGIAATISEVPDLYAYMSLFSFLIEKVQYVKEIFFSGNDDMLVGKLARRMMLHLSISVDEDVQQTLSFFEKIDARRGGLDMLGCCDTSFRYLVESFPRILLLSVESQMKPIVKFLENVGVPKERIGNVLLLYPPLLFLDVKKDIKARSWIFEKTGAVDKKIGVMLMKYPWVLSTSIQKNYEEIVALLETKKIPRESIYRAITDWPLLLGCSADKLKPMVEELDELGVKTTRLGKVIATSPQLLLRKNAELWKTVSFLQDMGFDKGSIGKILARCPEIFALTTVATLHKKLEFLTGLGILKQQHCRVVKKYPEFFVSDVDNTVMPRLRYLMQWGLSDRAIASMVARFSPLLGYSIEEVLKPKLEFLVNTMGKSVKEVMEYPRYFSYSLEKKIKPRFLVLKGRNIDCSLQEMLSKNDDEFASDYLGIEKMVVSIR